METFDPPLTPTNEALDILDLGTGDYIRAEALLSVEQKSVLATHLVGALNKEGVHPDRSANAEAVLRLIIWNGEPRVLESMAQAAASNPNTPHSLAWALANDDDAAAMPILEASIALSDSDLVSIVEGSENFLKMGAVACRSTVSAEVARSLALHGDEKTVVVLLRNSKADIPEDAFVCMLDRHGQQQLIQEGIINRDALSPAVADRLLNVVSSDLADKLAVRHQAAKAAPAEEPYTGPALGHMEGLTAEDLDEIVADMLTEKSITASFLVRKICVGNFEFFYRALAAVARSPKNDVRTKILASPSGALPLLWEKASLTITWLPIAIAAMSALTQVDRTSGKSDPLVLKKNLVDRALATLKADNYVLSEEQKSFFKSL